MITGNLKNSPRPRTSAFIGSRNFPRVSLSLHTMPQTSDSHFKKWLFLGLLIVGLMIISAILLFWK